MRDVSRREFLRGMVYLPLVLGIRPNTGAPPETFTDVGNTVAFTGDYGLKGKVVVAGLETLIIVGFCWRGEPSPLAVTLSKPLPSGYLEERVRLTVLPQGVYENEIIVMPIPRWVRHDDASVVGLYDWRNDWYYVAAVFPAPTRKVVWP